MRPVDKFSMHPYFDLAWFRACDIHKGWFACLLLVHLALAGLSAYMAYICSATIAFDVQTHQPPPRLQVVVDLFAILSITFNMYRITFIHQPIGDGSQAGCMMIALVWSVSFFAILGAECMHQCTEWKLHRVKTEWQLCAVCATLSILSIGPSWHVWSHALSKEDYMAMMRASESSEVQMPQPDSDFFQSIANAANGVEVSGPSAPKIELTLSGDHRLSLPMNRWRRRWLSRSLVSVPEIQEEEDAQEQPQPPAVSRNYSYL